MMYRSNHEIAAVVTRGLIEASQHDLSSVIRKMAREGVPRDVIQRVFIDPKRHRATDIPKSSAIK